MCPAALTGPVWWRLPVRRELRPQPVAARDSTEKAAILASSIELIQRAALQPGGDNFRLATQKLNQFFEGTPQVGVSARFGGPCLPATAVAAGKTAASSRTGLEPCAMPGISKTA